MFVKIVRLQGLMGERELDRCRQRRAELTSGRREVSLLESAVSLRLLSTSQAAELERIVLRDGLPERMGDFEVQSRIGKGGMGRVYLARQVSLDRTVALKVLSEELCEDRNLVARLRREAKATARINHPNVVQAVAAGDCDGLYYFVMEYVKGQTLEDRLRKHGGRLEPMAALGIVLQVAKGLAEAHDHEILHRDIKPANILISESGQVKVADLGLAKPLGDDGLSMRTESGVVMGTPCYMSPEQAAGSGEVDRRSDIYSLGATLYHVLTGHPPYEAASGHQILANIRKGGLASMGKVCPGLPRAVAWKYLSPLLQTGPTRARVGGFLIDRTEVTNADYKRFLAAGDTERYRHADDPPGNDRRPRSWDSGAQQDDCPVVGVDWFDAYAYAKWAGKRLATSEEWEKAARGTDARLYPWGSTFDRSKCTSALDDSDRPQPVDSKPQGRSPYGAFNMTGNVAEWVADPGKRDPARYRVNMGGEWTSDCRVYGLTYFRFQAPVTERSKSLGFRCARD